MDISNQGYDYQKKKQFINISHEMTSIIANTARYGGPSYHIRTDFTKCMFKPM